MQYKNLTAIVQNAKLNLFGEQRKYSRETLVLLTKKRWRSKIACVSACGALWLTNYLLLFIKQTYSNAIIDMNI